MGLPLTDTPQCDQIEFLNQQINSCSKPLLPRVPKCDIAFTDAGPRPQFYSNIVGDKLLPRLLGSGDNGANFPSPALKNLKCDMSSQSAATTGFHFAKKNGESDHPSIKGMFNGVKAPAETNSEPKGSLCFGPVCNLETLVVDKWWESLFSDDMYLKTDGDVVEDEEITKQEVAMLVKYDSVNTLLHSSPRVLDLCCGQGRHSLELCRQFSGLEMHGVDQSAFLVELARKRSLELAVPNRPSFAVGDCRRIPHSDTAFQLVLVMGNSFGYFSRDEDDLMVLKEIRRVLVPGGILVLDLTDGEYMRGSFSPRSWEWVDATTFVCRERQLSADGKRLISREVITDVTRGVVRDQVYQERLYSREEMLELLGANDFAVCVRQGDDTAATDQVLTGREMSKRQQDLGMMECRILLVATRADK